MAGIPGVYYVNKKSKGMQASGCCTCTGCHQGSRSFHLSTSPVFVIIVSCGCSMTAAAAVHHHVLLSVSSKVRSGRPSPSEVFFRLTFYVENRFFPRSSPVNILWTTVTRNISLNFMSHKFQNYVTWPSQEFCT